jgi:hypothetical protein
MKPKSPVSARTFRQFRSTVTTRRKMASMRVLVQRRRLRREVPVCAGSSSIFADLAAESNPNQRGYRQS